MCIKIIKTSVIATAFLFVLAIQSYIRVQVAIPNRWKERYAQKKDFIEYLNADQLKEMIVSDTTHYKVMMIYSTGLGLVHNICKESMRLPTPSIERM